MLSQSIERSWYKPFGVLTLILLPLSVIFCGLAAIRRSCYRLGLISGVRLEVPVVVVGNINVGGTGKTPLVVAIVRYLKNRGFKPGVVSRGYGGEAKQWPQSVTPESDAGQVGDEAVLIAKRCQCPVSVGPDRASAARLLVQNLDCDIIISDDGLQHLALQRDLEIVVIDGQRRFGNGFCLPAGPLRELTSRLNKVDLIVSNGMAKAPEYAMQLKPSGFEPVGHANASMSVEVFSGRKAHAVAGIGNNERFFKTLEDMNITVQRHAFPDHYAYRLEDITFGDDLPVLMTEKDAVKCKQFELKDTWYLEIDAKLEDSFYQKLDRLVASISKHS
ncbi:tetraacyldisaccharide 4'-kinase [Kaarinaea lacus]